MLRPKFLRARRHLKGRGGTNMDADRETQFGDDGLLQLNNKKGKKRSVVITQYISYTWFHETVRCNWTPKGERLVHIALLFMVESTSAIIW